MGDTADKRNAQQDMTLPNIVTARQPNLFVSADTIGPENEDKWRHYSRFVARIAMCVAGIPAVI